MGDRPDYERREEEEEDEELGEIVSCHNQVSLHNALYINT